MRWRWRMKVSSIRMLAAALAVAFSAPLFAQAGFPSGNGGTTGYGYSPGSNPGGADSKKKYELEDESITARYFTEKAPKDAKSVLERLKGITLVTIDEEKKRIEVKFTGNYDGLAAI